MCRIVQSGFCCSRSLDYQAAFQRLVDAYNEGSRNVEGFLEELVEFARQLGKEEQRALAENLDEEQLAIFDLLTRPDPGLSEKEKGEVKKIAGDLLTTLKAEKLALASLPPFYTEH